VLPGVSALNERSVATTECTPLVGLESAPVVGVAAGDAHSLFLTMHGDVMSVGRGFEGQLGRRGDERAVAPVQGDLAPERVAAIAAGSNFSLALTVDGKVFEWGLVYEDANARGNSRRGDDFARWRTAGVRDTAAVAGSKDELGPEKAAFQDTTLPAEGSTAARVAAAREGGDLLELAKAAGISEDRAWELASTVLPGMAESLGRLDDRLKKVVIRSALRYLTAAGGSPSGTGLATSDEEAASGGPTGDEILSSGVLQMRLQRVAVPFPRQVEILSGVRITQIAAGQAHSVVIDDSGRAYSCGFNDSGQLALGHRISVPSFQPIVRGMAAPSSDSIDASNALTPVADSAHASGPRCCPATAFRGARMDQPRLRSAHVVCAAPAFVAAACGQSHTLLLDDEGRVWGAGSSSFGQLGNGFGGERLVASLIPSIPVTHPDTLGASRTRLAAQTLRAVEEDASAGLDRHEGILNHARRHWPFARVQSIACGSNHSLMLSEDGSVWGFGHSEYQQFEPLGGAGRYDGDMAVPARYYFQPRLVGSSLADPLRTPLHKFTIKKVVGGPQFSGLITDSQEVILMGWNSYGVLSTLKEVGEDGSTNPFRPIAAFGPSRPALAVACGKCHALCVTVPEGDPAAAAWKGYFNTLEPTASDADAIAPSRSTSLDAIHAQADTVFIPLSRSVTQALGIKTTDHAPIAASASAGADAASCEPTAAELRATAEAAEIKFDRKSVVSRLTALLSGLASSSDTIVPRQGTRAGRLAGVPRIRMPNGLQAILRKATPVFTGHSPVIAARLHALRNVMGGEETTTLCLPGASQQIVVVTPCTSTLGETLLHTLRSNGYVLPSHLKFVVATVGFQPSSIQELLSHVYTDSGANQQRAVQLASLAKLLGAAFLLERCNIVLETIDAGAAGSGCGSVWREDMDWLIAQGRAVGDMLLRCEGGEMLRCYRLPLMVSDFFRVATSFHESSPAGEYLMGLEDVPLEVASLLIEWAHKADSSILDGSTVLPLLSAARRLCFDGLVREAETAIIENLEADLAAQIAELADALDLPRLAKHASSLLEAPAVTA
jgi:alpha-tubulin suppressor-like RCC1 family protein